MQIWFLDENPEKSAIKLFHLDSRRAFKQIVESAQIISQAAKDFDSFIFDHSEVPCKGLSGNKLPMWWMLKKTQNLSWIYLNSKYLCDLVKPTTEKMQKYVEFFNDHVDVFTNNKEVEFEPICVRSFQILTEKNLNCDNQDVIKIHRQILEEKGLKF